MLQRRCVTITSSYWRKKIQILHFWSSVSWFHFPLLCEVLQLLDFSAEYHSEVLPLDYRCILNSVLVLLPQICPAVKSPGFWTNSAFYFLPILNFHLSSVFHTVSLTTSPSQPQLSSLGLPGRGQVDLTVKSWSFRVHTKYDLGLTPTCYETSNKCHYSLSFYLLIDRVKILMYYPCRLLWRVNEMVHVKHLVLSTKHDKSMPSLFGI